MSKEALGSYLNDHLAGSVGAVEMMERVCEANSGTPLAALLTGLIRDIKEEQDILRGLLAKLDVGESPIKKAGAWLAEKAGRIKMNDTREGGLGRLEMLEGLSLGILGKLKLWHALEGVMPKHPELAGIAYGNLQARARDQHDRVEAQRLEAAREAL